MNKKQTKEVIKQIERLNKICRKIAEKLCNGYYYEMNNPENDIMAEMKWTSYWTNNYEGKKAEAEVLADYANLELEIQDDPRGEIITIKGAN